MAKYVGKIFRVNNKELNIKGNGSHFVEVKWFNPFTRKFNCRVITSLEDVHEKSNIDKDVLKYTCRYFNKKTQKHCVLNNNKYRKMRFGVITPIPFNKTENFDVWSAYDKNIVLHKSKLKNLTNKKIRKV